MRIEKAAEKGVAVLSGFLGEVEAYCGDLTDPADPNQIRTALSGPQPAATVLIASEEDEVLGFASCSFLRPAAGADTSIFLKELFVRESRRRGGVAGQLLKAVQQTGRAAGCSCLEWTADADNLAALHFYKALGVLPRKDKPFYRLPLAR